MLGNRASATAVKGHLVRALLQDFIDLVEEGGSWACLQPILDGC